MLSSMALIQRGPDPRVYDHVSYIKKQLNHKEDRAHIDNKPHYHGIVVVEQAVHQVTTKSWYVEHAFNNEIACKYY